MPSYRDLDRNPPTPANGRRCPSIANVCALDGLSTVCCTHDLGRRERVTVVPGAGTVIRTVLSGAASLCAGLPDGRRQILYLATPGDVICAHRATGTPTWIEALAPTRICDVHVRSADADASACQDLLLRASSTLLDATMTHLINIGRLDGTERVIAFLVEMTHRLGVRVGGRLLVQLPLNREDIADYLGLNAETVSRILGRIKRSGLVVFHSPSEFEVPDLADLRARSPIYPSPLADWSPRGNRAA